MTGVVPKVSRLARSAALAAATLACLSTAAGVRAETAKNETNVMAEVARVLGREQAAMTALAASRIEKIVDDRIAARSAAVEVTLASRGAPSETRAPARRLDLAALDALPRAAGDAQWHCLATAVYFEARGEPLAGQIGVAEVVLNRVDSRSYPDTICDVTGQGAGGVGGCQFSYACDGRPDVMSSSLARHRAEKLARLLIDGHPRRITDGATHFHATSVRPGWSRRFAQTAAIGNHIFYRQPTQVASR